MKIALIVPGGLDRSGREHVIPALLWLIERLAQRHEVLAVTLQQEPEPSRYPLLGAQVINLGKMNLNWLSGISRARPNPRPPFPMREGGTRTPLRFGEGLGEGSTLWQRLRQLPRLIQAMTAQGQRFDVLHAFWAGETGLLAGLAGRLLCVPVVLSIGGGELVWLPQIGYGAQGSWRGRAQIALALRVANVVTVGSHYAQAPLARQRPDAHWIPLGVDIGLFDSPVERPPGPPWKLLHVASINRVKDQPTLLRALRIVADQQPGVQLDLIGEDLLDGRLQQAAIQMGLDKVVQFHGSKPTDEIAPFYRLAHLYLQSSLHESQGVAMCEAAAAGVPTVGTAVGLVAELAPHAAWAVQPGDAEGLANGILALLQDSVRRQRMGYAAQAWARAHDADWTAAQFEAIFHNNVSR